MISIRTGFINEACQLWLQSRIENAAQKKPSANQQTAFVINIGYSLINVKCNTLSKGHLFTEIDGVGLATHICFP